MVAALALDFVTTAMTKKPGFSCPAALVGSRAAAVALRDRVRCQVGFLDQIANSPRELVGETMRAVFEDQ
jgi:hypothetical protein